MKGRETELCLSQSSSRCPAEDEQTLSPIQLLLLQNILLSGGLFQWNVTGWKWDCGERLCSVSLGDTIQVMSLNLAAPHSVRGVGLRRRTVCSRDGRANPEGAVFSHFSHHVPVTEPRASATPRLQLGTTGGEKPHVSL
ncbi:hypothetical protein GN956_G15698 [Arapaima gigas]